MQRTISAMVGKGSAAHNSREFIAENVDRERTMKLSKGITKGRPVMTERSMTTMKRSG